MKRWKDILQAKNSEIWVFSFFVPFNNNNNNNNMRKASVVEVGDGITA